MPDYPGRSGTTEPVYVTVTSNVLQKLKEGQGDNRYACFSLPEHTGSVMVDIGQSAVVFDTK